MMAATILALALSLTQPHRPDTVITVSHRENDELPDLTVSYRGSCDGIPVQVTIVRRTRRDTVGSVTMQFGSSIGAVPPTFLGGALVGNVAHEATISCGGSSVRFYARARLGSVLMQQTASLDLEGGNLRVSPLYPSYPDGQEPRSERSQEQAPRR